MFYIHIGSQKTGTTAIQNLLSANPRALQRAGFQYIKAGRNRIAHNNMNMRLKQGDGKTVCEEVVAEVEASPVDNHIISSELFFRIGATNSFKKFLPEDFINETKVICYVRRQDKYLEAMYKQLVKNGRIAPDPQAFYLSRRDGLAYSSILNAYADVFGQENIMVRPFEKQNFPKENVVRDFADILGFDLNDQFEPIATASNKSLSIDVSEMLGAVNRNTVFNTREIIREIIRTAPPGAIRSNDVFDIDVRRALVSQHAIDNDLIRANYCADRSELFRSNDIGNDQSASLPDSSERLVFGKQAIEAVLQAIGNIEARKKS